MSNQLIFQDASLPPRQRAKELVALLTREEKVRMVTNHLDGIPRLGIPEVGFGVEIARGLGVDVRRTKICGGGAKSPLWKQIIANVLNVKVDILENEEGPSMGGAMLAAVACGEYADVSAAADAIVRVVDTVEPSRELAAKYEERYRKFREIYPRCREIFSIIR